MSRLSDALSLSESAISGMPRTRATIDAFGRISPDAGIAARALPHSQRAGATCPLVVCKATTHPDVLQRGHEVDAAVLARESVAENANNARLRRSDAREEAAVSL